MLNNKFEKKLQFQFFYADQQKLTITTKKCCRRKQKYLVRGKESWDTRWSAASRVEVNSTAYAVAAARGKGGFDDKIIRDDGEDTNGKDRIKLRSEKKVNSLDEM